MIEHQDSSDEFPTYIKDRMIGTGMVNCRGITLPYAILKKDKGPKKEDGSDALPGFMGYHQFPGDTKKRLFISEEVPEKYREHVLSHEIYETHELQNSPHKCLEAMMWEIAQVPANIKPDYIRLRRAFFENLVKYNTAEIAKIDTSTPKGQEQKRARDESLAQFTESLNYLRSIDK